MDKILEQLNLNIQQNEKAINKQFTAIKNSKLEIKKIEKANGKALMKVNKIKIAEISKMLNKSKRSSNMKIMNQNKKISKLLDAIKATNNEIHAKKQSVIEVLFYSLKDTNKLNYNTQNAQFDSQGFKFNLGLKMEGIHIENSKINQYNINHFYNITDNSNEFVRTFVNKIKAVGVYEDDRIMNYEQSPAIEGFIITNKAILNKPNAVNFINSKYKADGNKMINTHYTKYITNLKATSFKDLLVIDHCQYVKDNYRPASCLLTAIINKFRDRFETTMKISGPKETKRRFKELTYSHLCELFEIPDTPSDCEVSLRTVIDKFFMKYNWTGLYVYSPFMELLYKKEPTTTNDNDDMVMRVIVKDNHIYEINDKLKQLQQQVNNEDDERKLLKVSDKYNVNDKDKNVEELKEVYCIDIDNIFETIKINIDVEGLKQLIIITPFDLSKILVKLIEYQYTPKVFYNSFLYKISIFTNDKNISIQTCDQNPMYGQLVQFENLEEYKAYNNAYDQVYKNIIKKEYISESHESVMEIEDTYKIRPALGHFCKEEELISVPMNALDENKAYTECIQTITQVPIFNYFDVYQIYDGHEIKDLSYYIIEVLEENVESALLFASKYSRSYGYILKACDIKYKILYFRQPLKTEAVEFKTSIDELYNNTSVCVEMKKNIVNKISGMLELKTNKNHLTKVFESYDEANHYAIKYDGKLLPVMTNLYTEQDIFCNFDNCLKTTIMSSNKTHCYLVNVKEEKRLVNGLSPIKDMIYLSQRLKMYNLYKKMISNGLVVLGCKTDCLFYQGSDKIIKSKFKLSKRIGEYKIEEAKYIPTKKLSLESNELITITDYSKVNTKSFDDEKDTETINKYIDSKKRVLIKGLYPGVGKSTMAKNYDTNALFILPYNRLCQNLKSDGYDAITFSKAFGLYKDDVELVNIKQYDLSEFDTIVFDEALLYTPERLKRLDKLMNTYPDKTFMSTGDTQQRNPIGFDDSEYLQLCMNIIFRDQVVLKDIKRLVNKSDIERWHKLKKDIFNTKMSVEEICKTHKLNMIHKMDDVKTEKNICYFNFRCDVVNHHVHKKVLKYENNFFEGMDVICRKYDKGKNFVINTNYIYKIKKITKADIKIIDEVDEVEYKLPIGMLSTHLKPAYAMTCDSVQGLSFEEDEKVTVFDANLPYTDRKYLWTAITRARKLDNVFIYIHSAPEVERFTDSKIKQYFKFKCDNYKQQDKKVNRTWD
jgi:hypothetical protein